MRRKFWHWVFWRLERLVEALDGVRRPVWGVERLANALDRVQRRVGRRLDKLFAGVQDGR